MSRRLLDDEQDELPQRERELTLSTGAILAIFLGLVILCGVFFGFGYNLGRRSTTTSNTALPAETSDAEPANPGSSGFDNFKPSPNSSSAASAPTSSAPAASSVTPAAESAPAPVTETQPAPKPTAAVPTPPHPAPAATRTTPAPSSTGPTQTAAPPVAPGGSFIVQIAAISPTHKDDADLLAGALRGRGYTVTERADTQDKLIHIQVGPFATKADAEAMREKLVVDGYNPIIK
jgi:cell division septation protein DedD